ncbi:MAG: 3-deoxy-manno-octulosonate cytidylyltransferase [SAR324 cluster bacterium]|uniref:3-deoxy-manno-octulosonate cytidylyltransferase n=1 Tax=SAR324 cluster bacterium TaxID=2024889 RepID=A0A7X9FRY5_9DELT|nr:3-deoxy-manno-octulosonate cytidylyltransferase [SAR324 cluster bacterium]
MTAKCLGVIPSRYASTRAPGKPLTDLHGKTLLQRVWEQAQKAKLVTELIIATDDDRIYECAKSFNGNVMMTGSHHATGSDRVAEVFEKRKSSGTYFDLVVNIQGDLPFINPEVIDGAIKVLSDSPDNFGMSTIATPILSEDEYLRPSAVKVALGTSGEALYFSRSPIPFIRNHDNLKISLDQPYAFKHMGLYVFRPEVLKRLSSLPESMNEKREQLEQLRVLSNGIAIKVFVATPEMVEPSIEIDTPEDIERARQYLRDKGF